MIGCVGILAAGCALEPGHGFATLRSASLSAALVPGAARDLGGGTILTNLAHRVTVTRAELALGEVALETLGEDAFDPANPPPGYVRCHSGHCDHESGRLVPYEEIAVESGGTYQPVVTLAGEHRFDLLRETEPIALTTITPSRELPEASLTRATVQLTALEVDGTIEGHGDLAVRLDLDSALATIFARRIDRHHPADIDLAVRVELDGTIFDDLEFPADLTTSTSTASEIFLEHLLQIDPQLIWEKNP